ncbi:MAG: sulfatase [Actinomycetota bacterium]|nr:sulfatase [Actinomycetota bacterium]
MMRGLRRLAVLGVLAVSASAAGLPSPSPVEARTPDLPRPNFIVIVTDDQEYRTLSAMSTVSSRLVDQGTVFSNAYVVNPTCCPSRASILTGNYAHTTGVYSNTTGFQQFDDSFTIATALDVAGYDNELVGKYLNGYEGTYVPPGWDHWVGKTTGGGVYYDYTLSIDGTLHHYGRKPRDYVTDVLSQQAVSFVKSATDPFFLYFAPNAPHTPAISADRYKGRFKSLPRYRPPSYDEKDVSDKPKWIRNRPKLTTRKEHRIDSLRRKQYRSLLPVDDAVKALVDTLDASDRLADTVILFTTDNGFLWGEHRLEGKAVPYEESIRVPFVIRYGALSTDRRTVSSLALNIDIAPTLAELAGITGYPAEGQSLVPLLTHPPPASWRSDFLVEHRRHQTMPAYCELHMQSRVFVLYADGEKEFYNLQRDPYERDNVAKKTDTSTYRQRLSELCHPPPPGMPQP